MNNWLFINNISINQILFKDYFENKDVLNEYYLYGVYNMKSYEEFVNEKNGGWNYMKPVKNNIKNMFYVI